MNTLKKTLSGVLLTMLVLTATATPTRASKLFQIEIPDLSVATAEITKQIAAELAVELRKTLQAPWPVRVRQSPTVSVVEDSVMVITASRLPPLENSTIASAARIVEVRL